MSARNTPTGGAGPRRSSRFPVSTVRRRASSLSTTRGSFLTGGPQACTIPEWNPKLPSGYFTSSSEVNLNTLDSIRRQLGRLRQPATDSNRSSPGLGTPGRTRTSSPNNVQFFASQDAPVSPFDKPLPPCPTSSDSEDEPDSAPVSARYEKGRTAPVQRQRTMSAGVVKVASLRSPMPGEAPRVISVHYDPQSQRATIIEGWPGGDQKPIDEAVFPPGVGGYSASQPPPLSQVTHWLTRKLDGLMSTAKTRIPKAFEVMINITQKDPRGHEPNSTGTTYSFIYVAGDAEGTQKSGTLDGVPRSWLHFPVLPKDEHTSPEDHPAHTPTLVAPSESTSKSVLGELRRRISTAGKRATHMPRPRLPSLRRPAQLVPNLQEQTLLRTDGLLPVGEYARGHHSRSNTEDTVLSESHPASQRKPPTVQWEPEQLPRLDEQLVHFLPYSEMPHTGPHSGDEPARSTHAPKKLDKSPVSVPVSCRHKGPNVWSRDLPTQI